MHRRRDAKLDVMTVRTSSAVDRASPGRRPCVVLALRRQGDGLTVGTALGLRVAGEASSAA